MKELLLLLVGSALSIGGGLIGVRWSVRAQRRALVHQARIALYVDLIANCQRADQWVQDITFESDEVTKGPAYAPLVPLDARVELLGTTRLRAAWKAKAEAHESLVMAIENYGNFDEEFERHWISSDIRQVVAFQQAIAEVRESVHQGLAKG